MKTVFKYLLAGFLLICVLGLIVLQVFQILDMNNIKKSIDDLKTQANSCQDCVTTTPTITPEQTMTVKLYYKNYLTDPIVLNCEADSFVERTVPKTSTPLADSIRLLLKNDLTVAEKNLGLRTEFNTNVASTQLALTSASITNGVATLVFNDPSDFTSGGACRSGILASQVELTAKQFSTVTSVELSPYTVFQP